MVEKKLEEYSVLELKGVLFDLEQQRQQLIQLIQSKLKEEQVKEVKEDGNTKE